MENKNFGIEVLKDFCRELRNHSQALQIIHNRLSVSDASSPEVFICLLTMIFQKNQTTSIANAIEKLISYFESEEK